MVGNERALPKGQRHEMRRWVRTNYGRLRRFDSVFEGIRRASEEQKRNKPQKKGARK